MGKEITAAELQKPIGVNKVSLADLAKRGVVVRGKKRGTYAIESIAAYCQYQASKPLAGAEKTLGLRRGSLDERRQSPRRSTGSRHHRHDARELEWIV
jgi:hypothetical protein